MEQLDLFTYEFQIPATSKHEKFYQYVKKLLLDLNPNIEWKYFKTRFNLVGYCPEKDSVGMRIYSDNPAEVENRLYTIYASLSEQFEKGVGNIHICWLFDKSVTFTFYDFDRFEIPFLE